jgi:hypothetical protein
MLLSFFTSLSNLFSANYPFALNNSHSLTTFLEISFARYWSVWKAPFSFFLFVTASYLYSNKSSDLGHMYSFDWRMTMNVYLVRLLYTKQCYYPVYSCWSEHIIRVLLVKKLNHISIHVWIDVHQMMECNIKLIWCDTIDGEWYNVDSIWRQMLGMWNQVA